MEKDLLELQEPIHSIESIGKSIKNVNRLIN